MTNDFNANVSSLFQGMDKFLTTKTVVGEPTKIGETIILPLVDVTFGVGAGAFSEEGKNNGAGALGGKMSACAVMVIQNGQIRLVNVKNQDTVTKLLDMVPDLLDRLQNVIKKQGEENPEIDTVVNDIIEEK